MASRKNLKLASFDSGGVRGLSQLEILEKIMHRLNWDRQSNGSFPFLPFEHFDLIGGSGTGGLIAIMLARLRMTVEEASEEFCTIIEEVYKQVDITPNERTQRLKRCIEAMVTKKQFPIDMKLLDNPQAEGCACFVVASPRINVGTKICLRSYLVKSHQASQITVVEAALATCATQPAFLPVAAGLKHKRKEYIGAGLGASNPTNEMILEAHSLFGGGCTVSSLLSLGSGHPGIITLPSNGDGVDLYGAMRDVMNDCTERAREIKQKIGRSGIYYRFSVEQGMQNDQPSQTMDPEWIVTQTESYLEEQVDQLEAFAKNDNDLLNVATLDQLKSGNVRAMLPSNLDMMNLSDAGPNNEIIMLAKLKPLDLECGPAIGECMEGTRQDVLISILDWASDFDAPNIFWVKGHPGVGKSAISVTLMEDFRKSGRLGSSFFFQREKANTLTPNALWRVVAYDLSRKYPTIRRRLLTALTANEALPTTLNTEKLFLELIHDPLTTCDEIPIGNLPVIVIDALDECGGLDGRHSEQRASLRRTLKSWSRLPSLFKLVVTSRGEADFEQLFSTTDHVPLEIYTGAAVNPHSLKDIKKFLEDQCHQIANEYGNGIPADWPGSFVIHELAFKSGGLFIWAKIIIGFLNRGEPKEQLRRILAGTGAGGMATLYSWILKAAFPDPSKSVIDAFHSLVGTIIIAKDPLPATSIMDLCSIDASTMTYICNGLQSVMTSGEVPRFEHQSIVDFLIDPEHCPPVFLIDRDDRNEKITLECLQVMQKHLRFNICDIESSYYRNNDIQGLASKIKERILPQISYSCCFWVIHLSESRFAIEVYKSVCDFMENRFLFWVEVLSLVKQTSLGLSMMRLLIDWLQSAGRDDKMALDMKKYISTFGAVISQSVPHIYLSTLPFSPQNSAVSKQYSKKYPQTISIRSGGQSDWPVMQNVLIGHTGDVHSVGFSPDGKCIVSGSEDKTIIVWDAETGEVVAGPFEGHAKAVTSVTFSPDGKRIISGSDDRKIRVWDIETGKVVIWPYEGHINVVASVALSSDGNRIASGSWGNTIRVWDAETGEVTAGPFKGHTNAISSVGWSPDGNLVVSGSWDNTIRVWGANTGKLVIGPFEGHTDSVKSVTFSPDGKRIASGSDDKTVRVWDAETGELVLGSFKGHTSSVSCVAFSPDGKRIVSSSHDQTIRVWDAETGEVFAGPFEGHNSIVVSVAFSPDGNRIVSGSWDTTVRLWDAEAGQQFTKSLEGHSSSVTCVAVSPDGTRIISGSWDHTIRIWDGESGQVVAGPFEGHTRPIHCVACSLNGKRVVSGAADWTIRIWDAENGEVIAGPLNGHTNSVTSVAISSDGNCVVSGSKDNTIRVWDVETGAVLAGPFVGHTSFVSAVVLSPDERSIASGSFDKTIRVWDIKTGEMRIIEGHTDEVTSVAFSPNGKRIVSGCMDSTIRVWDSETGQVIVGTFKGHAYNVESVGFSPNGRHIASGSYDKTIRVWDAETGDLVAGPFEGHTSYVNSVVFLLDGNRIASGSFDNSIRIWDSTDCTPELPFLTAVPKLVDGWILGPNSELLFWVPPELRTGLWRPGTVAIITRSIVTRLDFARFVHGGSWSRCKDPPPDDLFSRGSCLQFARDEPKS